MARGCSCFPFFRRRTQKKSQHPPPEEPLPFERETHLRPGRARTEDSRRNPVVIDEPI